MLDGFFTIIAISSVLVIVLVPCLLLIAIENGYPLNPVLERVLCWILIGVGALGLVSCALGIIGGAVGWF